MSKSTPRERYETAAMMDEARGCIAALIALLTDRETYDLDDATLASLACAAETLLSQAMTMEIAARRGVTRRQYQRGPR
jgi:hypothetical protein